MENGLKQQRISHLPAQDECTMEMGSQKYGSSAHCVRQNKMFNKCASTVGFVWESTIAQNANSSTMMFPRINITAKNVEYAELAAERTFFIVINVDSHICIERAMHHNCPVCFEYLFDTPRDTTVLPCGHTIHLNCVKEMERHFQYSCPVCSKSYCDMSRVWERLDQEVASIPMPQMYQNKMVWILCNDCGETSEVNYHILAHKCLNCKSYNTRQTRGGGGGHTSCSTRILEMVR
ncbi:E3 ubiquitin-protein ligase RZFP34 [Sesamum angolense]|uniref:E3 ubiquitin-protein ligase RZFP34 n=1 Tax=Sesamum angolense TaxID=2727404 RepID=A0AAE2BSX9_9LAMI|nr:E3 ubiquitin-protein ligase RZFP34 [Sesamum angolense]